MSYKDLLVHLDDSRATSSRIDAAIALAKRQDARITGVALALESTISSYVGIKFPTELIGKQREIVEATALAAIKEFEKQALSEGVEFRSEIIRSSASNAPAMLAYLARHADLSFISQPDPDNDGVAFQKQLLDDVLFTSGRPVYVVPYFGRPTPSIRTAIIAWDGGKKSARAVSDAIPLLKDRGETTVLMINPDESMGVRDNTPGEDIIDYLGKHDIKAALKILPEDELAPQIRILNFLADSGADLLIMGAYGHSRLRERAFGGVTDTIMHQMTTPVLMSA